MNFTRIAGWAAGVALVYGTAAIRCQSIYSPTETELHPQQTTPASTSTADTPVSLGTNIHFVATGVKAGDPISKICQEVLAVLLPSIQAYPHPDGWTWYVACDEAAWARIQMRQGNQVGSGILAITNRPARSTILRGFAMLHPYSDDFRARPEHVIAHELCHIYLQSSDEYKVDALATRWVERRRAQRLAVLSANSSGEVTSKPQ